ncbi:hypothetical protein MHU86_7548 [Fragilaria crotonensis]|nr:hypothetical protein MHU86_7548 [Fragilaria crotonensis]
MGSGMAVNSAADLTAVGRGEGLSGHFPTTDPVTRGGAWVEGVVGNDNGEEEEDVDDDKSDKKLSSAFSGTAEATCGLPVASSSRSAPNPAAMCCRSSFRLSMIIGIAVVDIMADRDGDAEWCKLFMIPKASTRQHNGPIQLLKALPSRTMSVRTVGIVLMVCLNMTDALQSITTKM